MRWCVKKVGKSRGRKKKVEVFVHVSMVNPSPLLVHAWPAISELYLYL